MITLALVDDEPTVRQALRMRLGLESDLAIVGEACDGATGIELVESTKPQVVLMDVTMPLVDGISATQQLRLSTPATAIIVLSLHDDSATRLRAKSAGAVAFIGKHESPETLLAAIRAAAGEEHG